MERPGPLGDAIGRHDKAAIAMLRATLPDVAARCALGAVYAKLGDKIRAALFLDGCDAATLDPEIADAVTREQARIDCGLEASQLSRMTIDSDPPGVAFTTDALPGEPLVTPATVWMPAGTYTISSADHSMKVEVAPHARGPIIFDRGIERVVKTKKSTEVDFTGDAIESDTTAPPPDQRHPSMLPCKYSGCETHAGDQLDDPFETKLERLPTAPPALELGVRAGRAMRFTTAAAASRRRSRWTAACEPAACRTWVRHSSTRGSIGQNAAAMTANSKHSVRACSTARWCSRRVRHG